MQLRGELRMIERAIKQGWQTPPAEQLRGIELAISAMQSGSPREQLAGLRVVSALIEHEAATDGEVRKRAQDALRRYECGQTVAERADARRFRYH